MGLVVLPPLGGNLEYYRPTVKEALSDDNTANLYLAVRPYQYTLEMELHPTPNSVKVFTHSHCARLAAREIPRHWSCLGYNTSAR